MWWLRIRNVPSHAALIWGYYSVLSLWLQSCLCRFCVVAEKPIQSGKELLLWLEQESGPAAPSCCERLHNAESVSCCEWGMRGGVLCFLSCFWLFCGCNFFKGPVATSVTQPVCLKTCCENQSYLLMLACYLIHAAERGCRLLSWWYESLRWK